MGGSSRFAGVEGRWHARTAPGLSSGATREPGGEAWAGADAAGDARPSGPPPPPPTRPVTARFDTTDLLHQRNATTTPRGDGYRHHPRARRPPQARPATPEPPRASDPTGPLERLRARRGRRRQLPTLEVARALTVAFGKFHGRTLGEIEDREPSYVSWLARAITRDPDLLDAARVVAASRPQDVAAG